MRTLLKMLYYNNARRAYAGAMSRAARRRLQLRALFWAKLAQRCRRGGRAASARAVRAAHAAARPARPDRRPRALHGTAAGRGGWFSVWSSEHTHERAHATHAGTASSDRRGGCGQRAVRRRLVPRERLPRAASLWLLVGDGRKSRP